MKDHTGRLQNSLDRMSKQLKSGEKHQKINGKTTDVLIPLSKHDKNRLSQEIASLKRRISGDRVVKAKSTNNTSLEENKYEGWVIDIYNVKFGYQNQADRKAAKKGGKRKKMKKKKTLTFLKSVNMKSGLLKKYKDGLMGISPKTHVFKIKSIISIY